MRLHPADIDFIALVGGDRRAELERWFEEWPSEMLLMCGLRPLRRWSLLKQMISAALLVCRGVRPRPDVEAVFYERAVSSVAVRLAQFRCFVPGKRVEVVTPASKMAGSLPDGETRRLLAGLWRLLRRADIGESALAGAYVDVVRSCLLVGSAALASQRREAYLFSLYRPETALVAAWLMSHDILVHAVTATTPLLPVTRNVIADDVIVSNPYQLDEIAMLEKTREWPPRMQWGPEEYPQLLKSYGREAPTALSSAIGLYTQGFRLRLRRGSVDEASGVVQAEHEERLAALLLDYLDSHGDARLVVFPHPAERRLHAAEGRHDLGALASHPQVTIDWDGASSAETFGRVGLGVTTFSTVGFDRVLMGHPTLFFVRPEVLQPEVESKFSAIFLTDEAVFMHAVDESRSMTPDEFMSLHFGGPFVFGADETADN